MATAISIIRRAMRLCRVLDAGEAAEAADAQDAREALNNMGQRWLASGLLPAWTDATGPTTTLVTAASANDALAYALAMKLAPEYGVELSPLVLENGRQEIIALWRDRLVEPGDGTVRAIILRALRILPDPARLPDGVDLAGGLATLNALLAEWHEAGIGLPDYTFATLAATPVSDAADRDAIAYQLAQRLAPEYGVSLPPEAVVAANEAMGRLRLRYFQPGEVATDLPGQRNNARFEFG